MNELPKELTPELLGLVLGEELLSSQNLSLLNNDLTYCTKDMCINSINTDTLTRLMKEFCNENNYVIRTEMHYKNSINVAVLKFYDTGVWVEPFNTMFQTEFEAVLKATDWVIKEKGLK